VFKHGVAPALLARGVEEMAATGQMSPDVLREASQQIGADPAMVQTAMNNAMKSYGQQFERHAAKAGVASGDFTKWAQANRADALKLAMVAHVTRQDARAYNGLLAEFKASRR
jgi:acetyl-CoA acetyltransferase